MVKAKGWVTGMAAAEQEAKELTDDYITRKPKYVDRRDVSCVRGGFAQVYSDAGEAVGRLCIQYNVGMSIAGNDIHPR